MKIAVDPYMFRTEPVEQVVQRVKELGYHWVELSPREELLPYYLRPRADRRAMARTRRAFDEQGVGIASVMVLYDWSSADERIRAAAVQYWMRAVELVKELGVDVINTEFAGDPNTARSSEAAFWKSLDELLPVFEDAKLEIHIEPHPNDFVEDHRTAVDMVRGVESPSLRYLYCAPHTFHLGDNIGEMVRYSQGLLSHVHVADSFDHRRGGGTRYIRNPANSTVRIHQHNVMGVGEVDFEEMFGVLAEIEFDGVLTACVLGWDDLAWEKNVEMRRLLMAALSDGGFSV